MALQKLNFYEKIPDTQLIPTWFSLVQRKHVFAYNIWFGAKPAVFS